MTPLTLAADHPYGWCDIPEDDSVLTPAERAARAGVASSSGPVTPAAAAAGPAGTPRGPRPAAAREPPARRARPDAPPPGAGPAAGTRPSAADHRPLFTDTDVANGRRFVTDHGADVRYVADWGCWAVFDGKRWVQDRA